MKPNKYLRKKIANRAAQIIEGQVAPKVTDAGPPTTPGAPVQPPAPGGAPTAPGAPKAPAAPATPQAKPKKEIEDEVESDVRKNKQESEKLDKIVETLETVVNALADQKKVLEKALNIKDVDEDLKELDEDEGDVFSAEEFGIDNDKLITSKEDNPMAVKSLRKERKARLYKESAAAEGPSKNLSEEFSEDKAKSKTFKPSAPAPTITKVKSDETPKMYKLAELALELNASKDKWVLLKAAEEGGEDTPLYEIEKTEENAENFDSEDFAKDLFKQMRTDGIEATLKNVNAQSIPLKPKEHTPVEDRPIEAPKFEKDPAEQEQKVAPAVDKAKDHSYRFNRAYRLALSAMQKNLTNNPLKSAFFETLTNLGMDEGDAMVAIEASFAKGAQEHFETALQKAEEFMEMEDESFVETESAIGELETKIPNSLEVSEPDNDAEAMARESMKKRAARGSLPLSTASKADPTDKAEAIFNAVPRPKLSGLKSL